MIHDNKIKTPLQHTAENWHCYLSHCQCNNGYFDKCCVVAERTFIINYLKIHNLLSKWKITDLNLRSVSASLLLNGITGHERLVKAQRQT